MTTSHGLAALACAALIGLPLVTAPGGAADKKKDKKLDLFWTHPDIASYPLRSVALLPAATFENDPKAEKEIESAWGVASRPTGYRWFYSTMSKDLLRRAFGGDSVNAAVRAQILKDARVDSLAARRLCTALHTSAVLSMRADLWEKVEMEWNQAGRPWTRVQIRAALVDSSGRLLWTASGSETAEGPMHNPSEGTLGVKSSGLTTQNVTGQGGAPSFQEAMAPLFARWVPNFPSKSGAAAPSGSSTPARDSTATPAAGGGR